MYYCSQSLNFSPDLKTLDPNDARVVGASINAAYINQLLTPISGSFPNSGRFSPFLCQTLMAF